jgi:hypothetical protein
MQYEDMDERPKLWLFYWHTYLYTYDLPVHSRLLRHYVHENTDL